MVDVRQQPVVQRVDGQEGVEVTVIDADQPQGAVEVTNDEIDAADVAPDVDPAALAEQEAVDLGHVCSDREIRDTLTELTTRARRDRWRWEPWEDPEDVAQDCFVAALI